MIHFSQQQQKYWLLLERLRGCSGVASKVDHYWNVFVVVCSGVPGNDDRILVLLTIVALSCNICGYDPNLRAASLRCGPTS